MADTRDAQARLVDELVKTIPEFEPVLREHLDFNEELLPHVLFGDLTRWVIGEYRESQGNGQHARNARNLLERTLRFLEERFTDRRDDAAQDLIAVSFLENLHQAGGDYPGLKALLGP